MDKIYAYMQDGAIYQIVEPLYDDDGVFIPLEERYSAEFVADCIDITLVEPRPSPNDVGVQAADGSWSFAPYAPPPPTAAEILADNTALRNSMLAAATLAIAPLQDAVDLGEATDAEDALLKSWKQFRIAVNRIDLTIRDVAWPLAPQSGYGAAVSSEVATS